MANIYQFSYDPYGDYVNYQYPYYGANAPNDLYPSYIHYPDSHPKEVIYIGQDQQQKQKQQNPMQSYDQYKKMMGGGAMPMSQNAYQNFGTDMAVDLSTQYGGDEFGNLPGSGTNSMFSDIGDWFSSFGGDSSSSSLGSLAYIAAAIIGQNIATNSTDTEINGVQTGNWFTGLDQGNWQPHIATEPWLAWAHDKLGWEPTAGEKFDAAMWSGGDWWKKLPAAADYYADPIRSWLGYDTWSNVIGDWAGVIDPIGWGLNLLAES